MEYTYENPLDKGYKQFTLTRKQHNQIFKYRPLKWTHKYEYYYNDKEIYMEGLHSVPYIIVNTVLFPVTVLCYGLLNAKDCLTEVKNLYKEKQLGHFHTDHFGCKYDKYQDVMDIINVK